MTIDERLGGRPGVAAKPGTNRVGARGAHLATRGRLNTVTRDVRLAVPEPEVLRVIGEESQRKGTDKLTSRQIDQAIKAARVRKPKRA
jgi:hypothetical protein